MPVLTIQDDNTSFTSGLEAEVLDFLGLFGRITLPTLTETDTSVVVTGTDDLIYKLSGSAFYNDNDTYAGWSISGISVFKLVTVTEDDGDPNTIDPTYQEEELVYSISNLVVDAGTSESMAAALLNQNWTINGTSGNGTSVALSLGAGLVATWNLGAGNDSVAGGAGVDKINGSVGSDTLDGGLGNDSLDGGSGLDNLHGGADNDYILAGASSDTAANVANGESGNDRVIGGGGHEILNGGNGNDSIFGNAGNDTLYGGTATAEVLETVGTTVLLGTDYLSGGAGNDIIYGVIGNDTLLGGSDIDRLYGGVGNDRMNAEAGNDRLYGEAGTDNLTGGAGDDYLSGGTERDILAGSDGNDTMYGGSGDDRFSDTSGNDLMNGGSGNDVLSGGAGDDTLIGGGNADKLYGGAGKDHLTGSSGADQFIFSSKSDLGVAGTRDVIADYNANGGDVIRLSALNLDLKTDGTFDGLLDGRSYGEVIWHVDTQRLRIDTNSDRRADYEIHVDTDSDLLTTGVLTLDDLNLIV